MLQLRKLDEKLKKDNIFKRDICRIGMWVLKLKISAQNQLMGSMAVKHGVSLTGYPLSYYKRNGKFYLIAAGFMFGEEKNKNSLIMEMKKSNKVIAMERDKDFIIGITQQPISSEKVYDPRIIRPYPIIINKDGYHIWELASFDKALLSKVIGALSKSKDKFEILKFRNEKISNISFTKLLPDLTKNQKKAMELAIRNGYYDYPKKVKMEVLAKKVGISYSTFQAHLKKAEGKIIPSIYKEL